MLLCLSSGTDLQKSRHVLKSLSLCNKVLSYLILSLSLPLSLSLTLSIFFFLIFAVVADIASVALSSMLLYVHRGRAD